MDTSFARTWLRLEGFATLLAAALFYQWFNLPWGWFALLFLAPDLAMLGYLAGSKAGALAYNLAHTYILALGLVAAGLVLHQRIGHGLGLKSPEGYRFTHLGKIGRDQPAR